MICGRIMAAVDFVQNRTSSPDLLAVIECLKARNSKGRMPDLYFFRDSQGNEVDLLAQNGRSQVSIEIKAASTFSQLLLSGLRRFRSIAPQAGPSYLVYNGDSVDLSDGGGSFHECRSLY